MKGEYVCEYVGEVITSEEADKRKNYDREKLSYLFDLTAKEEEKKEGEELEEYTIDAKKKGNVSRFINHSCDANLTIFNVFIDNHNRFLPLLCIFANRDIAAGDELTIDYKYELDENNTPVKRNQETTIFCKCNSKNCRKFLY